mmetsp:Transcript_32997/g.102370  ORF Transcript_32997/g.102370 Transcript_32997/m.102370 type:complete len:225 (+) Transcript_32997:719-1393(+)
MEERRQDDPPDEQALEVPEDEEPHAPHVLEGLGPWRSQNEDAAKQLGQEEGAEGVARGLLHGAGLDAGTEDPRDEGKGGHGEGRQQQEEDLVVVAQAAAQPAIPACVQENDEEEHDGLDEVPLHEALLGRPRALRLPGSGGRSRLHCSRLLRRPSGLGRGPEGQLDGLRRGLRLPLLVPEATELVPHAHRRVEEVHRHKGRVASRSGLRVLVLGERDDPFLIRS